MAVDKICLKRNDAGQWNQQGSSKRLPKIVLIQNLIRFFWCSVLWLVSLDLIFEYHWTFNGFFERDGDFSFLIGLSAVSIVVWLFTTAMLFRNTAFTKEKWDVLILMVVNALMLFHWYFQFSMLVANWTTVSPVEFFLFVTFFFFICLILLIVFMANTAQTIFDSKLQWSSESECCRRLLFLTIVFSICLTHLIFNAELFVRFAGAV